MIHSAAVAVTALYPRMHHPPGAVGVSALRDPRGSGFVPVSTVFIGFGSTFGHFLSGERFFSGVYASYVGDRVPDTVSSIDGTRDPDHLAYRSALTDPEDGP